MCHYNNKKNKERKKYGSKYYALGKELFSNEPGPNKNKQTWNKGLTKETDHRLIRSAEFIAKCGKGQRGKKRSEEEKKCISEGWKNRSKEKKELTRLKKSIVHTTGYPVYQYDLNGFFIKEWPSARTASKAGFKGNIIKCANGKIWMAGKFVWRFKKDIIDITKKIEVKNKPLSTKVKCILQFDLNGEFIKKWPSIIEARNNNKKCSSISDCAKGKLKTAGGFIWKYADKEINNENSE